MTPFRIAIHEVAMYLNLNPEKLMDYANEDTLAGYYEGGDKYAIPFTNDGKFLYALIRALKPSKVLEIGTAYGGSARHILEAMNKNKHGSLVTVDINPDARLDGIPEYLRKQSTLIHANSDTWIADVLGKFTCDFIHEDGAHSIHNVQYIYNHLPQLMPGGGVIASHDIATGVGNDIRLGMSKAGYENVPEYRFEGSPCGFSVLEYKGDTK